METLRFKTNIKCAGCVATVTPALNKAAGADSWTVDLESPDKILTISAGQVKAGEIKKAIAQAGFQAEEITG